jgi:hypothetical protein
LNEGAVAVSPVDGTFQHGRATGYVLQRSNTISYSSINTLCAKSKSPFKGLALTILNRSDVNEDEVSTKHTFIIVHAPPTRAVWNRVLKCMNLLVCDYKECIIPYGGGGVNYNVEIGVLEYNIV